MSSWTNAVTYYLEGPTIPAAGTPLSATSDPADYEPIWPRQQLADIYDQPAAFTAIVRAQGHSTFLEMARRGESPWWMLRNGGASGPAEEPRCHPFR